MVTLTNKQIDAIADDLNSGMVCYVNKLTGAHKSILDFDGMDSEVNVVLYKEELNEIEANRNNFVEIHTMDSRTGFRVMSSFASSIKNRKKKEKLFEILERKSPFRNFKDEVEHDPKYREAWFKHKIRCYHFHVREWLEGDFIFEAAPEEKEVENEINFEGKTFILVQNSNGGSSTTDTIFEYDQDGDLITAVYKGGSIKFGNIIGKVVNQQLHLVYQCLTNDNELKSGQAVADISFTPDGSMQLQMNWQWLVPGTEEGTSQYIEKHIR